MHLNLLILIVFGVCCTTVLSQEPIVTQTQHYIGDTFNITCDVRKFAGLTVVAGQDYLNGLSLWRQTFTPSSDAVLIAAYTPFAPTKITNKLPSQWTLQYSGGDGSTNRQTIRIVVTAVNFQCSDAGTYKCRATLPTDEPAFNNPVNITAKASIANHEIKINLHNGNDDHSSTNEVGENITLTCTVSGPPNLQITWKQTAKDSDMESPATGDISYTTPAPTTSSTGCAASSYSSELAFQLQETDDGKTYFCIVSDSTGEQSRQNFTIGILATSDSTGTPGSQTASAGPDVGAIVGGVIGGLVFLVIVIVLIYFFVIRKKNQDGSPQDKHKNVEATDNAKDNFSPPPVFYAKPHKPPKDDDGSRPVGMTNEGLDTSYDSKDLKGPPQYTNTVDDYEPPRYEKETHRGRANKAYEEEKEEKTGGHGRRNRQRDREESDEPKERSKDREERSKDREDRRNRHRGDREGEPRGRHYSTDDGTDNRYVFDPSYGDPNMGTSI